MTEIIKNNEKANKSLKYLGYATVGKLDEVILAELKEKSIELIKETQKTYPKGELYNLINANKVLKDKSNNMVRDYFLPTLEKYLNIDKVEIYPVSHIIKPFGFKSDIWHQDSSVVDDAKHFALNAWIPLVDSTKLNGCLWVFPGSHINTNYHRQFGFNPVEGSFLKKLKPYLKPITAKAGEILLFDRSLLHGSSNNYLPYPRIAVEALVTSKNAQMYNYHRDENLFKDKIIGFKVDSSHFLKENPKEDFYSGETPYELIDDITKEEMVANLSADFPKFIAHAKKIEQC